MRRDFFIVGYFFDTQYIVQVHCGHALVDNNTVGSINFFQKYCYTLIRKIHKRVTKRLEKNFLYYKKYGTGNILLRKNETKQKDGQKTENR